MMWSAPLDEVVVGQMSADVPKSQLKSQCGESRNGHVDPN